MIIDKAGHRTNGTGRQRVPRSGDYATLIHRLFRSHSALAVIGIGQRSRSSEAVKGIASELGTSGNRVVIVKPEDLLRAETSTARSGYRMDNSPNVWFWPDGLDTSTDGADESVEQPGESGWLGYLCREFDVVLLDCRATEFTTTATEVAGMADAAVLVVEAVETPKQQIQRVQRILEISGVRLAGCILMQRR